MTKARMVTGVSLCQALDAASVVSLAGDSSMRAAHGHGAHIVTSRSAHRGPVEPGPFDGRGRHGSHHGRARLYPATLTGRHTAHI